MHDTKRLRGRAAIEGKIKDPRGWRLWHPQVVEPDGRTHREADVTYATYMLVSADVLLGCTRTSAAADVARYFSTRAGLNKSIATASHLRTEQPT